MNKYEESKQYIPDDSHYKSEEYLLAQEEALKAQKMTMQDFLPVEFFHWIGMQGAGERGIISIILEDHPEYINILNRVNENALMVAARLNLVDTIKVLLENPDVNVSYSNENGSFLMYAVSYQSKNVINYVLDNHYNKIDFDCLTIINDTIYHLAARNCNIRLWQEITPEHFEKFAKIENLAGNDCLALAIEGYFQYKNHNAFEEVARHFGKVDVNKKNTQGISIYNRIKNEERRLILLNQPYTHLSPLKFMLGIDE